MERVAESAEGRLFGGVEAKARPRRRSGRSAEAVARARVLAGLPPDAAVETAESSAGWIVSIVGDERQSPCAGGGSTRWPRASSLVPFVASILPFADSERTVCALPFALTLR